MNIPHWQKWQLQTRGKAEERARGSPALPCRTAHRPAGIFCGTGLCKVGLQSPLRLNGAGGAWWPCAARRRDQQVLPPTPDLLWPAGRVLPRCLSPAAGHWVSGAVGLGALLPWLVLPSRLPGSIGEEPPASSHVLGPRRDPEQETNDLLRMRCLHSACSAQMKLKYRQKQFPEGNWKR